MNPNFDPTAQDHGNTMRFLGNAFLVISTTLGLASFADSSALHKIGVPDIPFRGTLPEPFDITNSGMSIAMGALLVGNRIDRTKDSKGRTLLDLVDIANNANTSREGRKSASDIAIRSYRSVLIPAVALGAGYVVFGEVGSEILHMYADSKGAKLKTLGHFDPTDIVYGAGAALAYAGIVKKRVFDTAKNLGVEQPKIQEKPKIAATGRTTPKGTRPQPKKRR